MRTADTELTYVALGVAALFAIATVLVAVWGVMQRQAIDEERAAQADLQRRFAFDISRRNPPPDPAVPMSGQAYEVPNDIPLENPPISSDLNQDSIWELSGDPMTDADLLSMTKDRSAKMASFYDGISIDQEKRVMLDALIHRYYAKLMYLGRITKGEEKAQRFKALNARLDVGFMSILSPDEYAFLEKCRMDTLQRSLGEGHTRIVRRCTPSMCEEMIVHVVDVILDEHYKKLKTEYQFLPDDELYLHASVIRPETGQCVLERLKSSLTPEEQNGLRQALDEIIESTRYYTNTEHWRDERAATSRRSVSIDGR